MLLLLRADGDAADVGDDRGGSDGGKDGDDVADLATTALADRKPRSRIAVHSRQELHNALPPS